MRSNAALKLVPLTSPTTENLKVTRTSPKARPQRRHLTPTEVERVIEAAGKVGRNRHRDATLVLLCYRHGLRITEAVSLRWDAVSFDEAVLHVSRLKNGTPSTHQLTGRELRALRRLQRENTGATFVFESERGSGPMSWNTAHKLIVRAGERAGLGFHVHPHMLRHATGYKLANDGRDTRSIQAYLGHRNIANTVIYTAISPNRFKCFWQD